jgi:glycosyltransferase involved in cell wall biosynthesis
MVRVSVVTTVYNGEPYFDRAVPSILSQTFKDFEWIIVDDGSQDRTPEFLHELASGDHRIKVFQPGRLGFARALNYAVERACGEYIVRQDFDDISYPQRIEKQITFLDGHPEIGVVGSYYVVVDEIRKEKYIRKPPCEHDTIVRAMACYIPFAHTLVTFRKKAWEDAGGYPLVDDIVDLGLWIRIAKAGWKLANIPEVLGEHFVHSQSFWHRNFKYARRQRDLAKVQWEAIRDLDLPLWMSIYPLGRYLYPWLPTPLKRLVRRTLKLSKEEDL